MSRSCTLRQMYADSSMLKFMIKECLISSKAKRIENILARYPDVQHSHQRYFRQLVNQFDNLIVSTIHIITN